MFVACIIQYKQTFFFVRKMTFEHGLELELDLELELKLMQNW